ncbi:hypothetical protein C8J56DRAFT_1159666 [Mycena floridula]|nr:hypothetical protein C8J56DRAFT_1159666 [Mycena floridula]
MVNWLCCGKSAEKHFADDGHQQLEVQVKEKSDVQALEKQERDLGPPSPGENFRAGATSLMEIVSGASKFAPPPVPEIVEMATKLIKAFENAEITLQSAEQLMYRIKGLLAVLVDKVLVDKVAKELPEELMADVEKLERDLTYIVQKLTDIKEQSRALLVLLPDLNNDKVRQCLDRLNGSLANFELAREIDNARVLDEVKTRIMALYTKQIPAIEGTLKRVEGGVEDVKGELKDVKALLQLSSNPSQSTMPRALPRPMDIFYGRDAIVAEAIKCLTLTPEPHWYALTGTGGIGKTSTAIAILHSKEIESHFGNLRFWVSCVKAKSIEQLDSALHGGIVGGQDTSSPREAVIAKLQTLEQPALVLLDNFETPWDTEIRSEVGEILRALNDLPQVSILMTIRAALPPGDGIEWTHKPVGEVDAEAGKKIYWRILGEEMPESEEDDVAELLGAVGFMPLAITLMAHAAKEMHQGAKELLAEYRRGDGTSLLGPDGKDSQHNMDICIQISIDRLPLDRRDASLKILAMFAMLPAGAKRDSFWFPDQGFQPIRLLLHTALLERRGDLYYVHPVIRTFILRRPISGVVSTTLQEIVAVACEFLKRNEVSLGDSRFRECADAIKVEESNIQAVLLLPETVDGFPDLLHGLVILARHQSATSPRLEVTERALKLADDSNLALRAEAFFCYGLNLHYQDHYERAMEQFQFAHDIFMSIDSPIGAADALVEKVIAFMYFTTSNTARKLRMIEQAQSEYATHAPGMARSAVVKGGVLWQQGDFSESLTVLIEASHLLLDSNQPRDLARCYERMSRIYFKLKDFDEGLKIGLDALKLYQEFSSDADVARMFLVLGRGYVVSGQPARAVEMFTQAIIKCTACGGLSGLRTAWIEISLAWVKMGQMDDAKEGLERASVYCSLMPQGEHKRRKEDWLTRYQRHLGDDQLLAEYEDAWY